MLLTYAKGVFSGDPSNKMRVDKDGLRNLTVQKMAEGLQSRPGNEIAGLEGRAQLLLRLADALNEKRDYFGSEGRPGNMIGKLRVCVRGGFGTFKLTWTV
jgi:hypothetical protein